MTSPTIADKIGRVLIVLSAIYLFGSIGLKLIFN